MKMTSMAGLVGLVAGVVDVRGAPTDVVTQAMSAAAPAHGVPGMSLPELIAVGGWLMYVLGVMSVLGVALVLYFLYVLRREQVLPRRLLEQVRGLIREGRIVEASHACRTDASAIASILSTALDYVLRTKKPDVRVLREVVDGEGARQATLIQNQVQYLGDIGGIAPMIGLLGTVLGMVRAFDVVALDLAKAKPMLLAAGVSQALVTTVGGLAVAIPAMIAYVYFRGRVTRLISEMEKTSADIVSQLVAES